MISLESSDAALLENAEEVRGLKCPFSSFTYQNLQLLESGLAVLKALELSEFMDAWSSVPQPYLDYPDLDPTVSSPFELPSILVPPEVIELDGLATDAGEDAQVKKEEWPEYFFRLFDNIVRCDVPLGFFVLTSMPDNARADERVWVPHSFQHPRRGRHFRGQPKGVCQTLARVSQMVHTGHVQAPRRSATSCRGRSKCEELAARERRDRGKGRFRLTVGLLTPHLRVRRSLARCSSFLNHLKSQSTILR